MYIGGATARSSGGVVISSTIPVPFRDEEYEKVPSVFPNDYREGCVAGAVCFVGNWDKSLADYKWRISNTMYVSRRQSTRGLVELTISELVDGRLLLMMRGSNTGLDPSQCPPRKWFSLSGDGGLTWSGVSDIRYDTGEQLFSPASIFRVIRSTKTGKLYFVGNITESPPDGNFPRYPLQIVEIDEEQVAFKKDTLTVIDDRDRDSEDVQFSNFSLLENRETLDMELYMTRLGENGGGDDTWSADCCRYLLKF